MKTKQQFEEELYMSYFMDRKKYRVLSNGIGLIFLIAAIMIMTDFINGNANYWVNTLRDVGSMFFIYFLAVPLYFYLRYSYGKEINLMEEKDKMNKQIKEAEEEREKLQYAFDNRFNGEFDLKDTQRTLSYLQIKLKYERELQESQERIWKLQFKLKMLGKNQIKNK